MTHPSLPSPPNLNLPVPRPHGVPPWAWLFLALGGWAVALRSADTPSPPPQPALPPIGTILAFGGAKSAVPENDGWLLCDGRELTAARYPALHAVIGSAWGADGDGVTFRLPDLRGRFLRGVQYDAPGEDRDPDRENRVTSAPGGHSGNEVGSLQEDAAGPHQHPLIGAAYATGQGAGAEWVRFYSQKVPDESAPAITSTWAVGNNPGPETRPRNVYVNWIIRAR